MTRFVTHLRHNLVAYIALFVALGGTSYAAVSVANRSIVPQKFNPTYIGGYVRAWVSVGANGHVLASGGGVHVRPQTDTKAGLYFVDWRPNPASRCTTVGSVATGTPTTAGYVVTGTTKLADGRVDTAVQVYNSAGAPALLPYDLVLVCGTPH